MDPSLEEPEDSLFNAAGALSILDPEPLKTPVPNIKLNTSRTSTRKHVFQDDSDSESWQTDSDVDEDEAAGVLKRLLKPNPEDLGNFKSGTPENGSQYLLTVMKEAKKTPKLVTAMNQEEIEKRIAEAESKYGRKYLRQPDSIEEVKAEPVQTSRLPTQAWEAAVISRFSQLHSKVDRWRTLIELNTIRVPLPDGVYLPDIDSNMQWLHFFFGAQIYNQIHAGLRKRITSIERIDSFFTEDLPGDLNTSIATSSVLTEAELNTESAENESSEDSSLSDDENVDNKNSSRVCIEVTTIRQHPQMSIMLNLGQRTLERLVSISLGWLKHFGWVHELQGEWFYALLVCLQKPLEARVMGDLREIAKTCRVTRAAIWKSEVELESGASSPSEINPNNVNTFLNTMNLFICIVGNYFQQRDLADTLTN